MSTTVEKFEQWCVVEIMGYKKFAGFVSEQSLGGSSFVRVDVPEIVTHDGKILAAFSKLFGAASICCLSPCTEETARAFASEIRQQSFSLYEAPRLPYSEPSADGVIVKPVDDDEDDFDDIEDDGGPW